MGLAVVTLVVVVVDLDLDLAVVAADLADDLGVKCRNAG